MLRLRVRSAVIFCLVLVCLNMPLLGQIGRATITGIVHDPTGSVIPGVAVTAIHVETGIKYTATTNETGNYTVAGLPVGQYTLTFAAAGFKEIVRSGLDLVAQQIARVDPTLEVGQVTEKVDVVASGALLQTETAQVSATVESDVFRRLPISFGVWGREMAAFGRNLLPGISGPTFAGWHMRINGTPGNSAGIMVDGMNTLSGFYGGNVEEHGFSPEAVEEMTVVSGLVTPEFGRGAGGTFNFTMKSGTNQVHGSAQYGLRNEVLNANGWNNNRLLAADPTFKDPNTIRFKRPLDRWRNIAVSGGGPVVLPKIYNGRNRTFFYVAFEKINQNVGGPTNLNSTTPQPEFFDGNLSRLLTGNRVGTDALGRTVYEGQVYDPSTLRQVNGAYVADPFLGNIIPQIRMSMVAQNFKSIFAEYYPPVTTALTNNLYGTRHAYANNTQYSIKGDHSISAKHKISGYYMHNSPTRDEIAGIWSLKDQDLGGPLSGAIRQNRLGSSWNIGHDWVVSPTLFNHLSFGANTDWQDRGSRHKGEGKAAAWGITGTGDDTPKDVLSNPAISLGSSPVATMPSWADNGTVALKNYLGYQLNEALSWQRRSHTFKFGLEWSRYGGEDHATNNTGGLFNFASRTTGIPGQSFTSRTGSSFASFLLGQVDSASMGVILPTSSHRQYLALYLQDNWKAAQRLTLNFGLRWNGDGPYYEEQARMATWSDSTPDPRAGNLPGAVIYTGSGPGRTGQDTFYPGYWKNFGPSFGFAYRISEKIVMRGGYGLSYTPETMSDDLVPNNFYGGLKPNSNVAADSKGTYLPVFNIDNGYPGTITSPSADASWGLSNGVTRTSPDYTKAGYIQHYNFGFQTGLAKDVMLEISFRGSKGTRLHCGGCERPNQIRVEDLARGSVLGQVISTPAQAAAAGVPYPYAGWRGTAADALKPFPQLNTRGLTAWGDPVGFTNYNSLNFIATKRMSKGLYAYGMYSFSKNIANVEELRGVGITDRTSSILDAYNRNQRQKTVAQYDMPHVVKGTVQWELPFGRKRMLLSGANRWLNAVIGDWTAVVTMIYESGTPLGWPSALGTPVGWNGGGNVANFNTPPGGFKVIFNPATFNPWNANDPGNRYFDATAFSEPAAQTLGNSPPRFPQVRLPRRVNEDATIAKVFPFRERARFLLRLELFNAFNRHNFGSPTMDRNVSYFGNVWTASGNRTGQLTARVEW